MTKADVEEIVVYWGIGVTKICKLQYPCMDPEFIIVRKWDENCYQYKRLPDMKFLSEWNRENMMSMLMCKNIDIHSIYYNDEDYLKLRMSQCNCGAKWERSFQNIHSVWCREYREIKK